MDENPFQSPVSDLHAVGVKSGTREDVRAVAKFQKGILVCILIQIIFAIGHAVISFQNVNNGEKPKPPVAAQATDALLLLGLLVTGVVGSVFVFLLAIKVFSTGAGVLLGILTLVPCLGLIMLLFINSKATSILRQNGLKVGLLGANLSKI
jgi:hypothetical protein